MGIFNNITIKPGFRLPLPPSLGELTEEEIYAETFQTKDLDYGMNYYTIHEDGSISEEVCTYEEGDSKIKEVRVVSKPQLINFYSSFCKEENDYWVEFQYSFASEPAITLTEFRITPNKDRKAREKEFWDAQYRRAELLNSWFMFLYRGWAATVRFVFCQYRKALTKIPANWQVERFLTPL